MHHLSFKMIARYMYHYYMYLISNIYYTSTTLIIISGGLNVLSKGTFHLTGKTGIASIATVAVIGKHIAGWGFW